MQEINHESYISLEVAKLLKEASFDWKQYSFYKSKGILMNGAFAANWNNICYMDGGYGSKVSAPTLEVAQRWLREVKNISVDISSTCYSKWEYVIRKINQLDHKDNTILVLTACGFYTYEETKEAGIKKALELIF